jgi:hypothetical protein
MCGIVSIRKTRVMTLLVTLGLAAGMLVTLASPAAAQKPSNGCGPGFNIGEKSFEQFVLLERTAEAIADGVATEDQILAGLSVIDANADEKICVQLNHGHEVNSAPGGEYGYNAVDNFASVPAV